MSTWVTTVNMTYFVPTMREPFVMSGDCTVVDITVDPSSLIPPSLPFCSIPPFTNPTMIPREPEIVPPDISPPDICNCITFLPIDPDIHIRDTHSPFFTLNFSRVTQDCCDPAFSVHLSGDIPCMPLSLHLDSTICIGPSLLLGFIGGMIVTTADQCALSLHISLQFPSSFIISGMTGPTGPTGLTGMDGLTGSQGADGLPGSKGADGEPGPTGPDGSGGCATGMSDIYTMLVGVTLDPTELLFHRKTFRFDHGCLISVHDISDKIIAGDDCGVCCD